MPSVRAMVYHNEKQESVKSAEKGNSTRLFGMWELLSGRFAVFELVRDGARRGSACSSPSAGTLGSYAVYFSLKPS